MLKIGLSHGAVIESEFLAIGDGTKGIHSDIVPALGYSGDSSAIGLAGM